MNKKWLPTKEALLYLKEKDIELTAGGLRFLGSQYPEMVKRKGYVFVYDISLLILYIGKVRDVPAKHMIKISSLAKELKVHVRRIYRKVKEYRPSAVKYMGTLYVNKKEFLRKYKEEYNGTTDGRKKARN